VRSYLEPSILNYPGYNRRLSHFTDDCMCLIFIAHRACPDYPLVIAANRDEYHSRPTAVARFWSDAPEILAGRDLEAHGTWLGLHRNGRFAALTNYRDPRPAIPAAPTRGLLVSDFLCSQDPALVYLEQLARKGSRYNGFSLLVHDGETLACYCNREGVLQRLSSGIHGLSNRVINTPWPKVASGRSELATHLEAGAPRPQVLFDLLANRTPAPESELPDTGVGPERERQLSPRFILGAQYGTRSSTVLTINRQGHVEFIERSFDAEGVLGGEVSFRFDARVPE